MSKNDWLKFRHNGIGGSEMGAVLGLNPYMSSIELYYQKLMPPNDRMENQPMFWGNALESLIAERWQYWDGTPESMIENYSKGKIVRKCRRNNAYVINPDYPHIFASFDRVINKNGTDNESILEIKTISGYSVNQWEHGIPPSYVIQLQTYLLVPDMSSGEIAMLRDGRFMDVMTFERNESICNTIIERSTEFWNRVQSARDVLSKNGFEFYSDELPIEIKHDISIFEPEPDGTESYERFLNARWKSKPTSRSGTEIEYQLGIEYLKLSDEIKKLEEMQREFSNKLKLSIADDGEISFGERGKITWRENAKGTRVFGCKVKS
jgi:putative phage-type endonuclease